LTAWCINFCFWLFELLGAKPEDEFIDIFPGTGIVTDMWEVWKSNQKKYVQLELVG